MRALSSLASRACCSLTHLSGEAFHRRLLHSDAAAGAFSGGNSLNSDLHDSKSVTISDHTPSIDHHYFSQVLSTRDWFSSLNRDLKAERVALGLNPQIVVSILQNQENPLHLLRVFIWVSSVDFSFAENDGVRRVLGYTLYRKGPILLSGELAWDIRHCGLRVREQLLCALIGSWGRLGLSHYCSKVFQQISCFGISLTTRLYNAMIDALVKSDSLDLAYLKFQQMSVDNCRPDRFTYNILVHGVCKRGIVDEALRLVKQMEASGHSPNVYTYSMLIDGFCNAKRFDEALKVLDTMREKNVIPSEVTVEPLIRTLFRCEPPHKAFQLSLKFIEKEPALQKFGGDILLQSLSRNNMAREAGTFLRETMDKGFLPNSETFNVTMPCLIKGLDLIETCEILDSLIERGVKPGLHTYLTLIEALYKVKRGLDGNRYVKDGNRYVKQMASNGLLSNVFSYNTLISCLCKVNMLNRAVEIFQEMMDREITPDLVTFNTLISHHCKDGNLRKAEELLEMLCEQGLKPDVLTFGSIICGLCHTHKIEDAFNCFTEMIEWGVAPNDVIYNILIRSLFSTRDVARSRMLLRKMQIDGISPDVSSFNALIQSLCGLNKVKKAEKLFVSMLAVGLNPDNITYQALIKALCRSGRSVEAKEILSSMEASGCFPDSDTCYLILDSLIQQDHLGEARDVIKRRNWRKFSANSATDL